MFETTSTNITIGLPQSKVEIVERLLNSNIITFKEALILMDKTIEERPYVNPYPYYPVTYITSPLPKLEWGDITCTSLNGRNITN